MVAPALLRNLLARSNSARALKTICARLPPAQAGDKRKMRLRTSWRALDYFEAADFAVVYLVVTHRAGHRLKLGFPGFVASAFSIAGQARFRQIEVALNTAQ